MAQDIGQTDVPIQTIIETLKMEFARQIAELTWEVAVARATCATLDAQSRHLMLQLQAATEQLSLQGHEVEQRLRDAGVLVPE